MSLTLPSRTPSPTLEMILALEAYLANVPEGEVGSVAGFTAATGGETR
ncbi:hypothetical protein [Agromyces humi]|nr:hypothetical protein [Agromyces humi]